MQLTNKELLNRITEQIKQQQNEHVILVLINFDGDDSDIILHVDISSPTEGTRLWSEFYYNVLSEDSARYILKNLQKNKALYIYTS